MAKPEWGTKRVCLSCGARFYDLHRSPITCPACGAIFDAETISRARRTRAAPRAALVVDEATPDVALGEDETAAAADDIDTDVDTEADEEAEPVDETEEAEEDEALIEDASELGEDDEDMSEVIESGIDEDEDHR